MPLVYQEASKRHRIIETNTLLKQLEIQGFAKCVARKSCLDNLPIEQQIHTLRQSLAKQFTDFTNAIDTDDKLEALADLRNVAALLFLVFEQKR
jgi:hypothetical protein